MKLFEAATIKLSAMYLAILMVITLLFSIAIYNISSDTLHRGAMRQAETFERLRGFRGPVGTDPDFSRTRSELLDEARGRLILELAIINLLILIAGGALCYYFARRTLEPIEASHAAQARFTADASHELRTPLAAMQTEIEVALRDPGLSPKEARELLASNLEEITKLTNLSDGLLQIARTGDVALVASSVDVTSIVRAATKKVNPLAQAKKIKIKSDLAKSLHVTGDAARLTELLVILLDNAIKYSQSESEVIVRVKALKKYVVISIQDFGIGIKKTDKVHIFDRFHRANNARTKDGSSGYGLGLAIAQNIAQLHKGNLSVKSTEGKGSTFTIRLPRGQ